MIPGPFHRQRTINSGRQPGGSLSLKPFSKLDRFQTRAPSFSIAMDVLKSAAVTSAPPIGREREGREIARWKGKPKEGKGITAQGKPHQSSGDSRLRWK